MPLLFAYDKNRFSHDVAHTAKMFPCNLQRLLVICHLYGQVYEFRSHKKNFIHFSLMNYSVLLEYI